MNTILIPQTRFLIDKLSRQTFMKASRTALTLNRQSLNPIPLDKFGLLYLGLGSAALDLFFNPIPPFLRYGGGGGLTAYNVTMFC